MIDLTTVTCIMPQAVLVCTRLTIEGGQLPAGSVSRRGSAEQVARPAGAPRRAGPGRRVGRAGYRIVQREMVCSVAVNQVPSPSGRGYPVTGPG